MIVIIGGGASGLMCAASVDLNKTGASGVVIEGTSRLGTKLLMSGGGHCNITHAGSIKDFIPCYGEAGKKIRKLLYKHNNEDLTSWLGALGIEAESAADGRIFPLSHKAADVLEAMVRRARNNGWEFKTDWKVASIKPEESGYLIESEIGKTVHADKLIIAAGGITYPKTGSDGSMHRIIERDLGISSTPLVPALAPIKVDDYPYGELAGLSVQNVTVTIKRHGAKDARYNGDMLFAHTELTGPVMLAASRSAEAGSTLQIDYNASDISELPKRLARAIRERAGESPVRLEKLLHEDSFRISSYEAALNKAMITAGGIPLEKEIINPGTLELAAHPGCFVIGELLDVDGVTGGYNLQFCYSSARAVADAL